MLKAWIFLGVLLVVTVGQGSPPFQLLDDQRGLPVHDLDSISLTASSNRIRLPTAVVPYFYYVNIITILEDNPPVGFKQFTAPGDVQIQVECVEATNSITLHSKGIHFTMEDVWRSGQGDFIVVSVVFHAEKEQVTITLEGLLEVGAFYMIAIKFVTPINEGLSGLYQSSYRDNDGNQRFLATTQAEATGARQIFPCFDEPALRAQFYIKIGYKQNLIVNDGRPYHALSNMERHGDPVPIENMDGYFWQSFKPPRVTMSTYLIAIIVSDFTSVASVDNVTVKTWGQIELMAGQSGVFSANAAQKLLSFFSTYFDIRYQLSKLDSVAIPDFAAGAMENWGLNTYRIPTVLFVTGDMTQFERWRQAAVIAHEVSHSWYGNYLTIKWWNDLWLKEGFARYLQFHGVAGGVETEEADNFGAKDRMVLDTIQIAMENDIGPNTHPVRGESTTEIRATNSRIIYEKGASLLRMMEAFINSDKNAPVTTFQSALSVFLREHQYAAAEQDELFETVQRVAVGDHNNNLQGRTVKEIMDTWTTQDGFPLVRVSRVSSGRIFVSQEKYVSNFGSSSNPTTGPGTWVVPIAFITKKENPSDPNPNNYLPKAWIGAEQPLISISVNTAPDQWILVNPEAMSYYRVMYDEHFFNLLKNQLEEATYTEIPTASRSQLLDDYFNFAFHSYAPITWALDLTKYLGPNEVSYPVWTTALTHFRKLYNFLRGSDNANSDVFENFKTYLGGQLGRVLLLENSNPVGWMLQALALDWGCTLDHDVCQTKTETRMRAWVDNSATKVSADIQPMIFCAAYRTATAEGVTWRAFLETQYANPSANGISTNQHRLLYSARGCAVKVPADGEEPSSLATLLLTTIDPVSPIPVAHRKALIVQIAGRDDGIEETLTFLEVNYVNIIVRLGDDAITTAIRTISTYSVLLETERRIQRFHDVREDELAPGVKTSIRDSIVIIQRNREWNSKFSADIGDWLADLKKP